MVTTSSFSSTNGVSFSGLASGINTSQLISSLVSFEAQAIKQPLLNKKTLLQAKLSALESLASKLSAIKTKADAIDTTATFLANAANSSIATLLSATASGSAIEGSHTVTIDALAQAETRTHATAFANNDTTSAGTGTLTITYGIVVNNITITDGTLNGLASTINAAGIGVTASVVNVNTPASPQYKLVLQGEDTGVSNTIDVDTSGLTGGTGSLGTFSGTPLVAASNAQIDVDGITNIQRETNTISDVIPGVTLSLLKADASAITVTVTKETGEIASKIKELVNAFNDAASYIKAQKTFKEGVTPGPLFGDLALNLASTKLSNIISGVQNTANPDFANLAQIGIKQKTDGSLEVDSEALEDAIDEDAQSVAKLFATGLTDGGVAVQLKDWLDDYLSTATTGLIQAEKDSINATIKDLDDQVVKADLRLDKFQDGLTKKYTALEALTSKLQSQQAFLSALQF